MTSKEQLAYYKQQCEEQAKCILQLKDIMRKLELQNEQKKEVIDALLECVTFPPMDVFKWDEETQCYKAEIIIDGWYSECFLDKNDYELFKEVVWK